MPMIYQYPAIPDFRIPKASSPIFQQLLNTYASETNKVVSVWRCFSAEELAFRPHPRSKTVIEIMKHQLLSERRFLGSLWVFRSRRQPTCCQHMKVPKGTSPRCATWPSQNSFFLRNRRSRGG